MAIKKFLLICISIVIVAVIVFNIYSYNKWRSPLVEANVGGVNISYNSWVDGKKIYFNTPDGPKETFLMGVNLGLGKPGYAPGELAISRQEYLDWFNEISDMGVNIIRVYTLQTPDFYQLLAEYNSLSKSPIYLIQGAYCDEVLIQENLDMWSDPCYNDFKTEVQNVIDAVHGHANIAPRRGHASGTYSTDVSAYVISYLAGIEFDGETTTNTDKNHTDKSQFAGKYIYTTPDATPFEAMLTSIGDFAIGYETDNYRSQKMIAFSNWPTTDPLSHPNEPEEKNNMDGFDVEHIQKTDLFIPGMYASYHVYPYYPDFLNYENQMNYIDKSGMTQQEITDLTNSNPYRQYLVRLNQHHKVPVIVAEFGVPTSRGVTHIDQTRGFNQGGVPEADQGTMLLAMIDDIKASGCKGGLIFSWQDEWFKKTWNTMELNTTDSRMYWHDLQTSEENFGLLAFNPEFQPYPSTPQIVSGNYNVFITSDAEYLKFKVQKDGINVDNDKFKIVLDVTPNSGITNDEVNNTTYEKPVDFIIDINGKDNSRVTVDKYYDSFLYLFSKDLNSGNQFTIPQKISTNSASDQRFDQIDLRLRHKIYLPLDRIQLPPSYYETGILKYGNIYSDTADYDSKADFIQTDNYIEIRIPWLMLNFSDPAKKTILDDFYRNYVPDIDATEIPSISIDGINVGLSTPDIHDIPMTTYTWSNWEDPKYTGRLKSAYYQLKDAFTK